MKNYLGLLKVSIKQHWLVFTGVSVGFVVLYYTFLMLLTILKFQEIPNYLIFHPIFHIYHEIIQGTPSWQDILMIAKDEAWLETGFKDPNYYGLATWSYMLIPPKMFMVLIMGLLLGVFAVLMLTSRKYGCAMKQGKKLYATAGVSTTFVSLTSATLTWVVCCATPSWVVALTMLGMNTTMALLQKPFGVVLMSIGLGLMLLVVLLQLKNLSPLSEQILHEA